VGASRQGLGRVKGNAIREFITWFSGQGEAERARLFAAVRDLPPDEQRLFDAERASLGILPSTWYPMEPIHRILDQLTRGMSAGSIDALAREAGVATIRGMQRGLYKVIFTTVMTPSRYIRVANMAWQLSYDTGRVENHELGPTRHRAIVRDWSGHHHFLCKMNVAAKAAIYEAMGSEEVVIEDRYCVHDGQGECGSLIAWR